MLNIQPVEFPGIESVLSNSKYYKDKFITDSVICFRNANLTEKEQFHFTKKMGKEIGWSLFDDSSKYVENHARKSDIISGPDDVIVEWHVEHTYYTNPIVASTWNMYNFKTNPENGKTYFIDTSVLFYMLSDTEQQFLLNSIIIEPDIVRQAQLLDNFISEHTKLANQYPIIAKHWLTKKSVIRFTLLPKPMIVDLVSYKDKPPTKDELRYFKILIRKIENMIWNNKDIRMVHKWQQGDLVIPDLFKLAHAVTGGFKPEDREFRGIWGYRD